MAYKIKCYIKRPDEDVGHSTAVSNTLENLQRNVGGYIEVVSIIPQLTNDNFECITPGVAVICDEEGRIKGKPHNCRYGGVDFVGDIVIVGVSGDEFCDVPIDFKTHKMLIG